MTDNIDFKGEAIAIDLGKRGVLFALTRGLLYDTDYGADIVWYAFGDRGAKGKKILPPTLYPMFVRFKDMSNSKTVQGLVDVKQCLAKDIYMHDECKTHSDYIAGDHFEELLGAGVKIKKVILETTGDPTTTGIEKYLPWLSHTPSSLSGQVGGGMTLYQQLNRFDFIREYL
jgi:hypothetical protein